MSRVLDTLFQLIFCTPVLIVAPGYLSCKLMNVSMMFPGEVLDSVQTPPGEQSLLWQL